jgi:galactokinase
VTDLRIEERFAEAFGGPPEVTARAPGRVNLIGEHTDYTQGFVLPVAIDRYIAFAARRRADRRVRARALDLGETDEFSLDAVAGARADLPLWSRYLAGVAALVDNGAHQLPGIDIAFSGNVPRESGLSSSAALEMGSVALWQQVLGRRANPVAMAELGQRVENEYLGIPSGIMDQFISALGRKGYALLLDCRSLEYRHVPLPADIDIVVANSGVKRALAKSEYGVRVRECAAALDELRREGVKAASLRDVPLETFQSIESKLSDPPRRRARHVISENQRVLDAVAALHAGQVQRFGELMNASHVSLRDDYQVSAPELDALVEIAWSQPGVLGARMTGAGFGGCTVNLARRGSSSALTSALQLGFAKAFGRTPEVYVLSSAHGAFA